MVRRLNIAVLVLFTALVGSVASAGSVDEHTQTRILKLFSATPVAFVENAGQIENASVRYAFYGAGANIFHTTNGTVFQLFQREEVAQENVDKEKRIEWLGDDFLRRPKASRDFETKSYTFSVRFVGAKQVEPIGLDKQQTKVNYYIGNDPDRWRTNLATYSKVVYPQLYDGIDLHTFGRHSHLKYEFHVAPGSDYSRIVIRYEGINGLSLNPNGALHVATPLGQLIDEAPYIYQVVNGRRVQIAGQYRLIDKTSYMFEITGSLDPNNQLIIDPDLAWATYLGGSGDDYDWADGITLDNSGNVFITSQTSSTDFAGANNTRNGGYDAFIAKVSHSGTLVWATYLGGSGHDKGYNVVLDGSGNVLIAGATQSTDFAAASNSFYGGLYDAFVAKVASDGALLWSTYLGGTEIDSCYGIDLDNSGNAFVTGETQSTDFAEVNNTHHGGPYDAFIAKINSSGSLEWSTYLGGSNNDDSRSIVLDSSNYLLVTGYTKSTNFTGATNSSYGGVDAWIARVSSSGSLKWVIYVGGSSNEHGNDIALDSSDNILITGETLSTNLASATNTYYGGMDAFVASISPSGALSWTTYLGGSGEDRGWGIAIDGSGSFVTTGQTRSTDFAGASNSFYGGVYDAFITKVAPDGSPLWSTYLGGSDSDFGYGIDLDGSGNVVVTGKTYSTDFAGTGNSFYGGSNDAFAAMVIDWGPTGSPPSDDSLLGNQEERSGSDADPVNTATGNFTHKAIDLLITSRKRPVIFSRYYNSKDKRGGPLGPGWTHSYNIALINDPSSGLISVRWGDGRTDYWNPDGLGGYEPNVPGLYDTLVNEIDGIWTAKNKSLDVYIFDSNGKSISISDKNGNMVTLAYSHPTDPNLLTTITDSVGGSLTLAYDSNGLLTSVTDFAFPPRIMEYGYTDGRLTQVIDVLSNTVNYGYDSNGYLETITDQRGVTVITNVYDSNGRVLEQQDGNGNTTLFAYDTPAPSQTTITDPNGNKTIHTHCTGYKLLASIENPLNKNVGYTYDENMNRTSITDRNGNITRFEYDARGNVISKADPNDLGAPYDGGVTVVEYSDSNFPDLPTKKTDALGNEWTYQYDANGNLIRQIDPNDNERIWTYNSFGQKLTETDENGNTINYVYDTNGLLTEVVDPNGNHTWYGYDDLWRLTTITDGRGSSTGDLNHTTATAYDNADRVISLTGPIIRKSYEYDNVGNRTGFTNGRGYTTVYEYDNNNNLTRIERIVPEDSNQVNQYTYDELNRKISMTNPNGNITTYEYDAAGRLTREINPESNETSYTYDAHGNILSVTDGSSVRIFYEYDALNRKIHQYDELGNHWYWQYDKLGKVTKHTDATGHITQYRYDSLGRLISVIDPAGNTPEYEYDAVGNLIEIIDSNSKFIDSRYYNSANRLICKEDGLGHAYEYSYDGAGNLVSRKDAENQITTYVYDNENRLIEIHYPDSNQVTYSYDNNGNLISMSDPTGTTSYTYDALDRLISSIDNFGKQVQYGYDIVGNRTSITYPADSTNPARTVAYTYGKANKLDKIADWAGRTWDYTVDGAGRVTDVNYPSGTKELRTYDDAGRLSSLLYKRSNDANLITYSYTYDAQGNPIKIDETGTLEPDISGLFGSVSYTYDDDNRLTSTTTPTYGYDNNGNITSRVRGGVTTTFTYDFENRLTSQNTGTNTVQHIYDGQGNRIAKIESGTETRYILDRGRSMSYILCETDAFGEIIAYYIHGPQILARVDANGPERYYHTNHIGSVVALTDANESVTDRYAYTPFGVPVGKEGSTPNPFTYIGGFGVMAETDDLYFMRARFYDPVSGRLLSKDPVSGKFIDPISLHKYVYAKHNPCVLIDPDGELAWVVVVYWFMQYYTFEQTVLRQYVNPLLTATAGETPSADPVEYFSEEFIGFVPGYQTYKAVSTLKRIVVRDRVGEAARILAELAPGLREYGMLTDVDPAIVNDTVKK